MTCDFAAVIGDELRFRFETPPRVSEVSARSPELSRGWRGLGDPAVNLSLSSSSTEYFAALHEVVDRAAFANVMVVSAMANTRKPTYPSEFASVFSVASHDGADALAFHYHPRGPAEWGARGIDVSVAWLDHATVEVNGNSFAAAHLSGILSLLLAQLPGLTPFQAKAVLSATATNAVRPS